MPRTWRRSPGLGLTAVGTALAALVFANWSYILSATKNSVVAAASLLALMGLALVYASREVRLGAGSVPPVRRRDRPRRRQASGPV